MRTGGSILIYSICNCTNSLSVYLFFLSISLKKTVQIINLATTNLYAKRLKRRIKPPPRHICHLLKVHFRGDRTINHPGQGGGRETRKIKQLKFSVSFYCLRSTLPTLLFAPAGIGMCATYASYSVSSTGSNRLAQIIHPSFVRWRQAAWR